MKCIKGRLSPLTLKSSDRKILNSLGALENNLHIKIKMSGLSVFLVNRKMQIKQIQFHSVAKILKT